MFRETELQINLGQIVSNYESLRDMSEHEFICPMLKANAYGHGSIEVGSALSSAKCKSFGVALYEEGIELRKAGISEAQILVFAPLSMDSAKAALDYNLTPVILAEDDIEILNKVLSGQATNLNVHLKVNINMNRLGFNFEQSAKIINEISNTKGLRLQGLCTHFPKAEDLLKEGSQTDDELSQFLDFAQAYEADYLHAMNSASIIGLNHLQDERRHKLGSRPGIALYGAVPNMGEPLELPIEEAMTLRSRIKHIQNVKKGQAVSYMGQWVAAEDSIIGVVPIGYADGVRRGLSGHFHVEVEGVQCPQVGVICMDYIMVDLTNANLANPLGAEVNLQMNAELWSEKLNTISYEVMTGMGPRLKRVYI